jgi:hypothetical protein
MTGQRIKQVWLAHGPTVPSLYWLSAHEVRDMVEAVVIAMIDVAIVAGMGSEE